MYARQFQEPRRGLHVGVHVNEGVLDRGSHARARGHVHNPLDALSFEDAPDEGGIAQVPLEKPYTVGAVLLEQHGDVRALGAHVVVVIDLGVVIRRGTCARRGRGVHGS